ncbi:MAG: hypothetical protein PF495_06830 [Spirochaetales bacterium]|nr:hypothetical protein [Spirochaetales bacterium]
MVQLSREELRQTINEAIAQALEKHSPPKVDGPGFRSRKETAAALHISIATLDNYTTQGLIEASRIGSRILYSRENIENALQKLEGRKWKRK